jgi:hypothetical protein
LPDCAQVDRLCGILIGVPRCIVRVKGSTVKRICLSLGSALRSLNGYFTLRLLTTRAISCTGPVWGRGSGPSSRRPRARVACVVWAWDRFVTCRLCRGIPAPAGLQSFALLFITICQQTNISPLKNLFAASLLRSFLQKLGCFSLPASGCSRARVASANLPSKLDPVCGPPALFFRLT